MFGVPIFQYISQGDYMSAFAYVIGAVIIIFLVFPFHESAHGWMANKLGDPTARYAGRLSFNPMRHIDWFGAALIMFSGYGWAKPVPVNMYNFKHPKRDMAITALAGPVSNLLMGLVASFLANGLAVVYNNFFLTPNKGMVYTIFLILVGILVTVSEISVGLAVFNLIPIPPLDGSRLLTALLPDRLYYQIMAYERYIVMGLFFLIFMGVLDGPLSFLRYYAMSGIEWLAEFPFRLFMESAV